MRHWKTERDKWEGVNTEHGPGSDLSLAQKRVNVIYRYLQDLLDLLGDINTPTTKMLSVDNFAGIKKAIGFKAVGG